MLGARAKAVVVAMLLLCAIALTPASKGEPLQAEQPARRRASSNGTAPAPGARPRFLLFTRAFNDAPYIEFVVDYYDALGFDRIILLDTARHRLDVASPEKLSVVHVPNHADRLLVEYLHLVTAAEAEWFFTVDSDELLLLNAPTIGAYVDAVERQHGRMDLLYFRWLIVDRTAPWCAEEEPFARAVSEGATSAHFLHRHIVRTSLRVDSVRPHCVLWNKPIDRGKALRVYHDGRASTLRAGSACSVVNKLATGARPSYADSALVHVHVRSVTDLLVKAVGTKFGEKGLARPQSALAALVRGAPAMDGEQLLLALVSTIGLKAFLLWSNAVLLPRKLGAAFGGDCASPAFLRRKLEPLLAAAPPLARSRGMCVQRMERDAASAMLARLGSAHEYERFARAVSAAYETLGAAYVANASKVALTEALNGALRIVPTREGGDSHATSSSSSAPSRGGDLALGGRKKRARQKRGARGGQAGAGVAPRAEAPTRHTS